MTASSSEFSVAGPRHNRRGPVRWLWSHLRRHPLQLLGFLGGSVVMVVLNAMVTDLTGAAFDAVLGRRGDAASALGLVALALLAIVLARGVFDLVARLSSEVLAKRLERDARDELYVSLLGKSQTFHNRQRVGDLMARAANDIRQLSIMITPGLDLIVDSGLTGLVPLFFIGAIDRGCCWCRACSRSCSRSPCGATCAGSTRWRPGCARSSATSTRVSARPCAASK